MLKLRFFGRLLTTFLKRFKGLLVLGFLLGVFMFFFINFISPILLGKKVEVVGLTGRYEQDNIPGFILDEVGDGLTAIDENGLVVPALSESWETTDKGKTWVFRLRDNIFWQDGKKIVSQDINYQFPDVTISHPSDELVVFELQEEFSPFPSAVSKPIFKKGLLGSGEWEVKKASVTGNYIETLTMENTRGERKIYKFYPTEERTKLAYKLGEVDILINIFNPEPFEAWNTTQVHSVVNTGQVVTLFFNTENQKLEDKSVRQALYYAIDKSSLSEALALSSINPTSWVFNPQSKPYPFSIERAKELLGENVTPEISLVTTPILLDDAEKIAKNWEALGIKANIQVSPTTPTDFESYLAILDIPKDPDQYPIWHSTQTVTNISKFKNARIDKLLEDGRTELNLEERRKIYLDFQRYLSEEVPAAFLYYPNTYTIQRK